MSEESKSKLTESAPEAFRADYLSVAAMPNDVTMVEKVMEFICDKILPVLLIVALAVIIFATIATAIVYYSRPNQENRFKTSGLSASVVKDSQTGKEYLCVYNVGIIEVEPTKPESAK